MDSPSKAKRAEIVKQLRGRTVVLVASGESEGSSKSVSDNAPPSGGEHGKSKEREAPPRRVPREDSRKQLKDTLAGAMSFSGDEADVGIYARNGLAAGRRLALFAETWADFPELPLSTVRAALRLYLDEKGKADSFGIGWRDAARA
jgi:hypothetical protein